MQSPRSHGDELGDAGSTGPRVRVGTKTLHRVAGCVGATAGAGVEKVGAHHGVVGGWIGEGLDSRADTGTSVLGDWENRLLLGFVSISYWALKINYRVEE